MFPSVRMIILIAMFFTLGIVSSCKEPAPPPQQNKKPAGDNALPIDQQPIDDGLTNSNNNNNNDDDDDRDDDCDKPDRDDDDEDEDEDEDEFGLRGKKNAAKKGFSLQSADYNYDDDIKDILEEYCIACHDSGSNDGDFSTYRKASGDAAKIGDWVDDDRMPPSGSKELTSTAKRKLLQWVEDDAPESAGRDDEDEDEDDDRDDDDDDRRDDCDDDDDEDDDNDINDLEGSWDELLNPDELKSCKKKDKVYDRTAEECHKADIAESYDCTRSGIIKKFKEQSVSVEKQLDQMDDDGYKLDQCGEFKDDPIVFFIKKTESSDTIGLKVRRLCRKGTAVCE